MADLDVVAKAKPTDLLPGSAAADGQADFLRADRRRGLFVNSLVPTKHLLSAEGSAWALCNPTPGTAVTYALQQTFSDTVGFMVVKNNDPAGGRMVTVDYLKLVTVAVGASATSVEWAIKIDTSNRAPTAGSTLLTPSNTRQTGAPAAQVWVPNAASLTVPASVSARLVGRGTIRSVIPVARVDGPGLSAATTAGVYADHAPAFTLQPQEFAVIYLWEPAVATTAPSFEFELAGWDR
jgi:hypothetical protein